MNQDPQGGEDWEKAMSMVKADFYKLFQYHSEVNNVDLRKWLSVVKKEFKTTTLP
jgi:hypothetical protein